MQGSTIFLVVFLILLLIGGGVAYYYFIIKEDKNNPEEIIPPETYNFYLKVVENNTNNLIEANYDVYWNNSLFSSSKTNTISFEKVDISPYNKKIFYLKREGYYNEVYILEDKPLSMVFSMNRLGDLKYAYSPLSNNFSEINLTLASEGYIQDIILCLNWGANILDLNINGIDAQKTVKEPSRYKNRVVKCYDLETTINNQTLSYILPYKRIDILSSIDYIKIIVIDKDKLFLDNNSTYFNKTFEDLEFKDIGVKDTEIEIKFSE